MEENRTKEVGSTASRIHSKNEMWESTLFDYYVELPFAGTTIRCSAEYDKILTKQYGDWRIPIKNGSRHEMVVIDVNTPWREFIKV